MDTNNIELEINAFRHITPFSLNEMPDTMVFSCAVFPPQQWNKARMETELQITFPVEMEQLWNEASCLQLFKDETYGQWGIIIWSPEMVLTKQDSVREWRQDDFLYGDIAIGEFLGDSDIIILRCNSSSDDFGSIVIANPIDPRNKWQTVASSMGIFLKKLRESKGDKYWET